jgi:hypothetical protein
LPIICDTPILPVENKQRRALKYPLSTPTSPLVISSKIGDESINLAPRLVGIRGKSTDVPAAVGGGGHRLVRA